MRRPLTARAAQTLTRKLVHIICGTGFLLTWLLFRRAILAQRQRHATPPNPLHFAISPPPALRLTRPAPRSNAPEARYIAALVPFANGVRLAAIGSGALRNEAAVKAISRQGDPRHVARRR